MIFFDNCSLFTKWLAENRWFIHFSRVFLVPYIIWLTFFPDEFWHSRAYWIQGLITSFQGSLLRDYRTRISTGQYVKITFAARFKGIANVVHFLVTYRLNRIQFSVNFALWNIRIFIWHLWIPKALCYLWDKNVFVLLK